MSGGANGDDAKGDGAKVDDVLQGIGRCWYSVMGKEDTGGEACTI